MIVNGPETTKRSIRILLSETRGFCAGVVRAIDIVERALETYGPPVYVRHEIVHNRHVVDSLREKGVIFVKEVNDIPIGAVAVFSAHGVSRRVEDDSKLRELHVIDATCPLVKKVHNEAHRYSRQGREIILIGHNGHPEVEGTMGQIEGTVFLISTEEEVWQLKPTDPAKLAYVTQTTLSVDDTKEIVAALKKRFPQIVGPGASDICYATQNRQDAVKKLMSKCDLILVIGAQNSSNSNRLREICESNGTRSLLIPDAGSIDSEWFKGVETVGVTAGASAPEILVQQLVARLGEMFDATVESLAGVSENVVFRLPREFRRKGLDLKEAVD
ncbi:MAG: 4-hydroxy-3-methylbut-2-enyl diphosphate reductase [Roseovarius sp.]|nr:4-hydroxy-3-methylbut-2-enyl diphosphate reductase [Roseovarius sp.]MCY4207407.1 4-hydroxy-3-methylbut-2-enyl diphosphate reductase [Roseovarius sp.]